MSTEVFGQLGVGIIITDLQGKIRYVNDTFVGLFGTHSDFEGLLYTDAKMPWIEGQKYKKNKFLPIMRAIRVGHFVSGTMELEFTGKEAFKLENFASPLRNKSNQVVGAINISFPTDRSTFSEEIQAKIFQRLKKFTSLNTWDHITKSIKHKGNKVASKEFLTMAFVDIVNFSALTRDLPSAQIIKVLNIFFNRIYNTIIYFNGDVDKYMGDGLFATFYNAEAAVRCFVNVLLVELPTIHNLIREQIPSFPDFSIQVGIHSGWVLHAEVGAISRREYTVIGDDVDTTLRIQSHAKGNEIRISESSLEKLGDFKKILKEPETIPTKQEGSSIQAYRFDRESIKINPKILLYDSDNSQLQKFQEILKSKGITKIISSGTLQHLQTVMDKSFDTIFLGPNTKPRELVVIRQLIQRLGIKKDLVIPITRNANPETLKLLNKYGIQTYVPNGSGKEFARNLENSMRTQALHKIPPQTNLNQADIPKNIMYSDQSDSITSEEPPENAQIGQTSVVDDSFSNAILYNKQPNQLEITTMKVFNEDELDLFCKNIAKIWEFSYHSKSKLKLIIKFENILNGKISKGYIKNILFHIFQFGRMKDKGWRGTLIFQSSESKIKQIVSEFSERYRVKFEAPTNE